MQGTGRSPQDVSNNLFWAGTIVRLKSPAGATEIDSLQAQSKLFRSLVVILGAMVIWRPLFSVIRMSFWLALLSLSIWRYCKLRWDASQRTYEYFLGLALPTSTSPEIARLAYSYWQERGHQGGSPGEDWTRAEEELKKNRLG
jgi:hypothetical protein